jgi:hypothetical protein
VKPPRRTRDSQSPRRSLSANTAATLALICGAPLSHAAPAVTNCNASGIGSLETAINGAVSGDTIDMTALPCSSISIADMLFIEVLDLTIAGPGINKLTLTSSSNSGTLYHQKLGNLTVKDMTISSSNAAVATSVGGCVKASGNLTLLRTAVKNCHLDNTDTLGVTEGGGVFVGGDLTMTDSQVSNASIAAGFARGGGIAVHGNATINGSTISSNSVTTKSSGVTRTGGGGLSVVGSLTMNNSVVSGNTASSAGAYVAGGGIYVGAMAGATNYAYLGYSTLSENAVHSSTGGSVAKVQGGGMYSQKFMGLKFSTADHNRSDGNGGAIANGPNAKLNLFQSTISGNDAAFQGGAIFTAYNKTMSILNSTIGMNYSRSIGQCAGIFFDGGGTLSIVSTIVAQNHKYNATSSPCDLAVGTGYAVTITGTNNLIEESSGIVVPGDTLFSDPQFFPLAKNGGLTRTLGIQQTSPARQTGSNVFSVDWDQRGAGFPRTLFSHTDIGAFEWEFPGDGDTIFRNGFDPLFN